MRIPSKVYGLLYIYLLESFPIFRDIGIFGATKDEINKVNLIINQLVQFCLYISKGIK